VHLFPPDDGRDGCGDEQRANREHHVVGTLLPPPLLLLSGPPLIVGLFEHAEHAVSDEETADGIGRGAGHREKPEHRADPAVRVVAVITAGDDEGADQRDRRDRVRGGHQRRVKQRRDPRDQVVAEEAGQHEDVQADFQIGGHIAPPASVERAAAPGAAAAAVLAGS
jgi:hypothetical protein